VVVAAWLKYTTQWTGATNGAFMPPSLMAARPCTAVRRVVSKSYVARDAPAAAAPGARRRRVSAVALYSTTASHVLA